MGVYDTDYTDQFNSFVFRETMTRDQFNQLPSFPGSGKMVNGQPYQWFTSMVVTRTGRSDDGADILVFAKVEN